MSKHGNKDDIREWYDLDFFNTQIFFENYASESHVKNSYSRFWIDISNNEVSNKLIYIYDSIGYVFRKSYGKATKLIVKQGSQT